MQGVPTKPDAALAVLDGATTAAPDFTPTAAIARATGVSQRTVQELLVKYQPVAEELRVVKRDHLLGGWQWIYLSGLEQLGRLAQHEANATLKTERDLAAIRRDISVSLGIATEKALLISGQPTAIVGHLHELRVSLPQLLGRLAGVAREVQRPQPVVVEGEKA